jgi:hypothetical protein
MNKDIFELYSDYLLSSFSRVTATGLSQMTGAEVKLQDHPFPRLRRDGF